MIYLDNAATTLHKPPEVAEAVKQAILTAGNAARGAHCVSLAASRTVFETRQKLAQLFSCPREDHVVFTMNSTEALNIAIYGLLSPGDHVISTDLEHNSVLRPLYDLQTHGVFVETGWEMSGTRILKRCSGRTRKPSSARMRPI